MIYNRHKAAEYAKQWASARNPKYYNFDNIGGDCTNFVSQCLYAGTGVMNFTRDIGWYYISLSNRSAAWSSAEYLYKFLINNRKAGPYAVELPLSYAEAGDIIQLSFDGVTYAHSLFVISAGQYPSIDNIFTASHSFDAYNRPLKTYSYQSSRLLHISGFRV